MDSHRDRGQDRQARRWSQAAGVSLAGHHAVELAAGIGLPGEPLLGRRRALLAWGALFPGQLALAACGQGRWDRLLAATNGAFCALAMQHYLSWPWRLRHGIPVLTDTEGLPARWLPAYNLTLLATIIAATIGSASECPAAAARWHLYGLATYPSSTPPPATTQPGCAPATNPTERSLMDAMTPPRLLAQLHWGPNGDPSITRRQPVGASACSDHLWA